MAHGGAYGKSGGKSMYPSGMSYSSGSRAYKGSMSAGGNTYNEQTQYYKLKMAYGMGPMFENPNTVKPMHFTLGYPDSVAEKLYGQGPGKGMTIDPWGHRHRSYK